MHQSHVISFVSLLDYYWAFCSGTVLHMFPVWRPSLTKRLAITRILSSEVALLRARAQASDSWSIFPHISAYGTRDDFITLLRCRIQMISTPYVMISVSEPAFKSQTAFSSSLS